MHACMAWPRDTCHLYNVLCIPWGLRASVVIYTKGVYAVSMDVHIMHGPWAVYSSSCMTHMRLVLS